MPQHIKFIISTYLSTQHYTIEIISLNPKKQLKSEGIWNNTHD